MTREVDKIYSAYSYKVTAPLVISCWDYKNQEHLLRVPFHSKGLARGLGRGDEVRAPLGPGGHALHAPGRQLHHAGALLVLQILWAQRRSVVSRSSLTHVPV